MAGDPEHPPIGDIYYLAQKKTPTGMKQVISHFTWDPDSNSLNYNYSAMQGKPAPGWGNWEQNLLPELRQLDLSLLSGKPSVPRWADQVLSTNDFLIPRGRNKTLTSLERVGAYAFYKDENGPALLKEGKLKVKTNAAGARYRKSNTKLWHKLDRWKPTRWDKARGAELASQSGNHSLPLRVHWEHKIPAPINSQVLLPKFVQLLYWLITGTLTDGIRRHRIKMPDAGLCPHCGTPATARHMFDQCPLARMVWTEIDNIGHIHFPGYIDFRYNDLTDLWLPSAKAVYQVMGLWALWCQWLEVWNVIHQRPRRELNCGFATGVYEQYTAAKLGVDAQMVLPPSQMESIQTA